MCRDHDHLGADALLSCDATRITRDARSATAHPTSAPRATPKALRRLVIMWSTHTPIFASVRQMEQGAFPAPHLIFYLPPRQSAGWLLSPPLFESSSPLMCTSKGVLLEYTALTLLHRGSNTYPKDLPKCPFGVVLRALEPRTVEQRSVSFDSSS